MTASQPASPNGLLAPGCDPAKPPPDPEQHFDCRFPVRSPPDLKVRLYQLVQNDGI